MATQVTPAQKNKPQPVPVKEVALKQETSLTLASSDETAWGAEEASAEDIIIPKLLLMHGQSKLVLGGENAVGELVRSKDGEVLAKRNTTVRMIPFKLFKSWRVSEKVGDKYEFRRNEPYKLGERNELPWEFEEEGKKMRRDFTYNFYAIQAGAETSFPLHLQFTRTSKKAGQVLADHFAISGMFNRPPAVQSFEIGSEFVQGNDNSYFIFTAKPSVATTKEELAACRQWYDMINASGSKIKEDLTSEIIQEAETKTNKTEEF